MFCEHFHSLAGLEHKSTKSYLFLFLFICLRLCPKLLGIGINILMATMSNTIQLFPDGYLSTTFFGNVHNNENKLTIGRT